VKEYEVGLRDKGARADVAVAEKYPQFSRSALAGLFELGKVSVNGSPAKAGYKLKPGDIVAVDETLLHQKPPAIKLPVIYDAEDVLVINKPVGILTHSKGGLNTEPTVASFIKNKLTDKSLTGNRAGIVHRLDRGTSGVIITAKTQDMLKYLQKQFSTRKVKKIYWAIVQGSLEPPEAIIDAPIARNPNKPQTFFVSASGKSAITKYKLIKQFERDDQLYSLLELQPQTGRTHQLRVHLAYIGRPIVGDSVYGHGDGGILLHAGALELNLPDAKRKSFSAEMPPAFKEFMDGK
jgi:23S rRNA pseudouridine1911/1915/1917 synthase